MGEDFAFTVRKTTSTIEVEFMSNVLQSRVSELLEQHCQNPLSNIVDGFELLEHSGSLETYLRRLRTELQRRNPMGAVADPLYEQMTILEAELALLVKGLVGDHQMFQSFGYEDLHEKGHLTNERWMAWTNSRISEAEDHLDRTFHAIGQAEGVDDFDIGINDDLAEQPFVHPFMLSEPSWEAPLAQPKDQDFLSLRLAASNGRVVETQQLLDRGISPNEPSKISTNGFTPIIVEAIRNGHQQVVNLLIAHGAYVDGTSPEGFLDESNSPLIAAIYKGGSEIITQLLDHGANPRILLHIKQEEQWLVARSLIDHGVDGSLLLSSLRGLKVVDPRLLYVLQDGGADIFSARPASTEDQDLSLRLSDHDAVYVHNTCVRTRQMISAIGRSDLPCVEAEIGRDADPTFGIDAAISNGDPRILRSLLHKGADLRYLEFGRKQASLQEAITADACLIMVAEEGFTSAVGSILRLRKPSSTIEGRDGKIFLINLIRLNKSHILKMLLTKGVFSRDFVADSSEWSLPVAAKSSMIKFRQLLEFGTCVSTALFATVAAGNSADLLWLLKGMREINLEYHVNNIRDGMTPLMLAVCKGAGTIAEILLGYGANSKIETERGDIFTMAEENGFINLAKVLRRGSLHLQSFPQQKCQKISGLLVYWSKMKSSDHPGSDEKLVNEIRLRALHREFKKEHARILTCAQSSSVRESRGCVDPRAWGQYGFSRNYSIAWRRGMATMRAFRRGEATSNLNDAIWFLTIAKAKLVTDTSSLANWQVQFMSDLDRYQRLFSNLDGSLDAFRSAVKDIWGASLTYPPHDENVDLRTLKYFQELAGSLLHSSESPLRHREDSDYGLITSQRRWRMHQPSTLGNKDGEPDPFRERIPENVVERGPADSRASGSTDFREGSDWQEYESHSPFRDTIHSEPYVSAHCTVALTIMAGFIFSMLLAFLLGKISNSSTAYSSCWALLMNTHSSATKPGPTHVYLQFVSVQPTGPWRHNCPSLQ